MSRPILRQCQFLKGVHHNGTKFFARPFVQKSLATSFVRRYAKATTGDEKPSIAPLLAKSAILIPRSVKNIQPKDLLQRIEPLPREEIVPNSFCIILVTPSFASWLVNDKIGGNDSFLAQAVRRIYQYGFKRTTGRLQVDVLCAVIDKLPAGRPTEPGKSLQETVEKCASSPGTGDTGFEGIAFATLPSAVPRSSASTFPQEKGAIDFTLNVRTTENKGTLYDTWRLPLANTVFHNGRPTTMLISRWDLNVEIKSPTLLDSKIISHQNIDLSFSHLLPQTSSILNIPLSPLTFPRTTDGCMGNIIRRIVGPDKESITASSELEKVVPEFFKARGEPARPTTVWALVMPNAKKRALETRTRRLLSKRIDKSEKGTAMFDVLWKRLWQADDPWRNNTLVTTALAEGARLHRVLSGGGGWGKKAGLLSLDPVPVEEEVSIRAEDASSAVDGPGDFSSALTPVVQDKDAIQFFIQPTQPDESDDNKRFASLQALPKQGTGGLELGTVPSTIDSIPGHPQEPAATGSEDVAIFKNSFGALTEGGLTLTRHLKSPRLHPAQRPVYTTMIDVPYSRMWSVGLGDGEGSTKHLKFSWEHESTEFAAMLQKKADKDVAKKRTDSLQSNVAKSPFRRVIAEKPLESSLANEKLYQIKVIVAGLGVEYRFISRNIEQRLPKDLPAHIRRVTGAESVHRFVVRESVPEPRYVASRVATLQDMITRFLNTANFRAFEIYGLHLALRLRLGKMILHRRGTGAQYWLATQLIELRSYNKDLYCRKSGKSTKKTAQRLLKLELRNPFQRSLVLPRVPSTIPLDQWHRDLKNKRDAPHQEKLPIRYRRVRRSNANTTRTVRPRRMRRQIIRQHLSDRRKFTPIRHLPVGPRARLMHSSSAKSRRASSQPASKSNKAGLLDSVSGWLGDEIASAEPVKETPRRPFGSRASASDDQSSTKGGGV